MLGILKKRLEPFVKLYSILPLISCFLLNMLVYSGTMALCRNWYHHDFTTKFDLNVPLIPWFMYIYFGCFAFWIVNYIMIGRLEKEHFYRFVTADMMSRIICGIFFILIPTTNVALRIPITGDSFSEIMLRFLYQIDQPTNLFPSIHCLVSWMCFVGIRRQKDIPIWYRAFSCVFAILVCVSTQVTKQHYIVDVFGGIVLAEIVYFISSKLPIYKVVMRFFDWVNMWFANILSGKELSIEKQEKDNT